MSQAEELKKLHDLKESGALSEAEFEQAKADFLSGASTTGASIPLQKDEQWAMYLHLSQYAGFVVPLAGFALPIILWQMKKDEVPGLDAHGKVVTNWMLTAFIYQVISIILMVIVVGIIGIIVVALLQLIFPIIGAIKANDGILWRYPTSINFFS